MSRPVDARHVTGAKNDNGPAGPSVVGAGSADQYFTRKVPRWLA